MTDKNSITPPLDLIQKWRAQAPRYLDGGIGREAWLILRAAQWGADMELDACCEQINEWGGEVEAEKLRTLRRLNPPSLKEQALDALASLQRLTTDPDIIEPIRRALEQPEPQRPTDEELLFAYDEFDLADSGDTDVLVRGLRAVLARWGNR